MSASRIAPAGGVPVLEVVEPGLLTTVQDLGRPGLGAEGVTPGGAADTWSLAVANALIGNDPGAAALETTLLGPVLRALRPVTVGIAGALPGRILETGEALLPGTAAVLREGATLSFDPPERGLRGYVAVPGGVAVPLVLGSRSTALGGGFGGIAGRALRVGDRIAASETPGRLTPAPARWPGDPSPVPGVLRVLPGPHGAATDLAALVRGTWTVRPESDRVGLRLAGVRLAGSAAAELASHGVVPGAIQLPPDGLPIVLLADHQPTGGYPVVGVIIRADLPRLGQLGPGMELRFEATTPGAAREALREGAAAYRRDVRRLREDVRWDELWRDAAG